VTPPPGTPPYLAIELPERFVLSSRSDDGAWFAWGEFRAADFSRLDDGSYVCAGHGGSPVYLRCTRREGALLHCLDGGGGRHTYRLEPCLPGPGAREQPGSATPPPGERRVVYDNPIDQAFADAGYEVEYVEDEPDAPVELRFLGRRRPSRPTRG